MLNAMIVDDEKAAIDALRFLLEKTGQVRVVGSFISAVEALSQAPKLKPDVVFLDIEMPEISGLRLAEEINAAGHDMKIIFVTAYERYALDAFRVSAIDYILKPLSPDDVGRAVDKLKKARPTSAKTPAGNGRIYCFGGLSVYGAEREKAVKWRTSKAEELFAFMLQNLGTDVPRWKIAQVLWPEYETKNLNTYLHTTVYQVKKTLQSANVDFDLSFINGRYRLELPGIYIDTQEFSSLTGAEISLSETSVERCKRALGLYRGNYLGELGYSWSQGRAEKYLRKYCGLVSALASHYAAKADYANADILLRSALENAPLDDSLNEALLNLFLLKKDKSCLIMHYNRIKELYRSELGITPNAAMQSIFGNGSAL